MRTATLLTLLMAIVGQTRAAAPQEPADRELDKSNAAETSRLAKEELAKWDFTVGADRQAKPKWHPEPVFRWSNPVTGPVYGDVYIWTIEGRPQVVVSVHKFFTPTLTHMSTEFHSLAFEGLTAVRNGQAAWHPPRAGIELTPIPSAPAPATTAIQRLHQMRNLARQFSASSMDRNDESWQLRLIPKPVYRYESANPDLLDGAMFTFVQGTNPEVWLLIEAPKNGDSHEWQYALARFNGTVELKVRFRGDEIWSVPRIAPPWEDLRQPESSYVSIKVQ